MRAAGSLAADVSREIESRCSKSAVRMHQRGGNERTIPPDPRWASMGVDGESRLAVTSFPLPLPSPPPPAPAPTACRRDYATRVSRRDAVHLDRASRRSLLRANLHLDREGLHPARRRGEVDSVERHFSASLLTTTTRGRGNRLLWARATRPRRLFLSRQPKRSVSRIAEGPLSRQDCVQAASLIGPVPLQLSLPLAEARNSAEFLRRGRDEFVEA